MNVVHGVWIVGSMEARRHLPFLQWRTAIPMFVVSLALALSWSLVADDGLDPGAEMFVAEMDGPSPYAEALAASPAFRVVAGDGARFEAGTAHLFVSGERVAYDESSERSRAAAMMLDQAIRIWVDEELRGEGDAEAAFPVRVAIHYETRDLSGMGQDDGATTDETLPPSGTDTAPGPTGDVEQNGPEDSTQQGQHPPSDTEPSSLQERSGGEPALLRPDDIEPPFPIRSLLLTFAYVIPWSFLAQVLAGSILHERLAQRGRLLLSTPWSGATLLAGLGLPYYVMALLVAVGVSWWIGAGWLGFLGMLPVLFVLFSASALVGLLARSQREMTFLLVGITTALSTFLFLPAMFIQIHPIAFASPVAIVSYAIRGQEVPLASFLYGTVPLVLMGGAMMLLGAALFREEHLFSPAGLLTKVVDGIQHIVSKPWMLLAAGFMVVPFAFVLQLFVLVIAVMLELQWAFLLFVFGSAAIEEMLKGVPAYAHRQRLGSRSRSTLWVGGLIGGGFFLGEKIALLIALAGFGMLPMGQEALLTFGLGAGLLLLMAPLVLHMATASVTASQARRGRGALFAAWWVAVLIHVAYNLTIVIGGVGQ